MHARFYNGQIARFLSVDPLQGSPYRPQSMNRYAYVLGNPINFIDPSGLEWCAPNTWCESVNADTNPKVDPPKMSYPLDNDLNLIDAEFGGSAIGGWGNRFLLPRRGSPSIGRQLGNSFAAFFDGLIIGGDPLAALGLYDPSEYWIAQLTGEFAPSLLAAVPRGGTSVETTLAESFLVKGAPSDFVRTGRTIVSNQLINGPGSRGAQVTWGIKGGGVNPRSSFALPFHYQIHKYNWYTPWRWFTYTPILR